MNATYIIDLKTYYIKLNAGKYLIDGEEVDVLSSMNPIVVNNLDNIIKINRRKVITHYNSTDGESLENDEYNKKISELLIDADEDMYFDNIDAEYEYKKFKQQYLAIWQDIITEEKLEFVVHGYVYNTGNQFIESPILKLNNIIKENLLYEYKRKSALTHIFNEAIKELSDNVLVDKSHSLEYAKLNGDFIFTAYKEKFKQGIRRGTLDDLKKLYDDDVKFINNTIKKYFVLKSDKTVKELSLAEINNLINKLSSYAGDITPIKRSDNDYNTMISCIRELKTAFDTALIES